MTPNKNVQRNNVNSTHYNIEDVKKSGYKMGYSSQLSGKIGLLQVGGYNYVMPNDKFSGGNSYRIQFEPLAVPMTGRMKFDSHNFMVTMRSVYGVDFQDFCSVANRDGGGNSDLTLPQITLKQIVKHMVTRLRFPSPCVSYADYDTWLLAVDQWLGDDPSDNGLYDLCKSELITDFWTMYSTAAVNLIQGLQDVDATTFKDAVKTIMYALIDPFVGEGSMLDHFGYPIISHVQFDRLYDQMTSDTIAGAWYDLVSDAQWMDFPVRAQFFVWWSYYRNVNAEPKYKFMNPLKWTMAPLSDADLFKCLLPRFRNWDLDMFTGAEVDDISHHVYAKVPGESQFWNFNDANGAYLPAQNADDFYKNSAGSTDISLSYVDIDGVSQDVTTSFPSIFAPNSISDSIQSEGMGLQLLELKRAKMLERYLKRNFAFGDLYRDRLLAHYGINLSDKTLQLPEYLGGSTSMIDVSQEVNNTTTAESPAGEKTAVMTGESQGDGYNGFAEEFGIVLNIISLLPECSYDCTCPQLSIKKFFDLPLPEFANQDDMISLRQDVQRTAVLSDKASSITPFAHHPYMYAWRSRVNDFHGNALSVRKMYNFGRMYSYDTNSTPKFNASFLHCNPSLNMFVSSSPLYDFWFGYGDHDFFVERALPQVVENI